jgi:hypothetical protein
MFTVNLFVKVANHEAHGLPLPFLTREIPGSYATKEVALAIGMALLREVGEQYEVLAFSVEVEDEARNVVFKFLFAEEQLEVTRAEFYSEMDKPCRKGFPK